ncbi:peptide-methionine (S)-S-oxide reductase MsrA [Nitrosophilus alvini]|uniref:peptide-methionine (S)-S-oxide reductase MsrA n=1 Tax=Nitrosophilus alvini TaxID=2714855 RepID=UPI00190CE5E6|nr:peptide-methionine (S)-S-oxide reductase MsrA [Nitrosophilus alvini]
MTKKSAVIGGGCFWCMEAVYRRVKGVTDVVCGYAGGDDPCPTYEKLCSGLSGHAEVVKVEFDPDKISYEEILKIFFAIHDPTTLNRQGADIGTQYRSIILYADEEQKETAKRIIKELNPYFENRIVTELKKLELFCPAEDYHQNYYERNPYQGYCMAVIAPKIEKFMKNFKEYAV